MLRSMTGYGDAHRQDDRLNVVAEVRTVNNRFLKVTTRLPEVYAVLEGDIERLIRDRIARGTVSITLRADSQSKAGRYSIDKTVLRSYWEQLSQAANDLNLPTPTDVLQLLDLPGVVLEQERWEIEPAQDWPLIKQTLQEAIGRLNEFRDREGEWMRDELRQQCEFVREKLTVIGERAPGVVVHYRNRLKERVGQLLRDSDMHVEDTDLIREVSLFADRCDINEEITRLRSHLEQFVGCLDESGSAGRKLEFLCQEMFREVNTIGSKANDVEIAHAVVEMKGSIEKMREIVQNVE